MTNENGNTSGKESTSEKKLWNHDEKFSEKTNVMFRTGQTIKQKDRSSSEKKRQQIKYAMALFS